MAYLSQTHFTDRRIKYTAVSMDYKNLREMNKWVMTFQIMTSYLMAQLKEQLQGLLSERAGPQGIAFGAAVGGIDGFIFDD